jgi:hypothetical protein
MEEVAKNELGLDVITAISIRSRSVARRDHRPLFLLSSSVAQALKARVARRAPCPPLPPSPSSDPCMQPAAAACVC